MHAVCAPLLTSQSSPSPPPPDAFSYDAATAKHSLIYTRWEGGVDTDVYIEDLESGSQQVRVVFFVPWRKRTFCVGRAETFNSSSRRCAGCVLKAGLGALALTGIVQGGV